MKKSITLIIFFVSFLLSGCVSSETKVVIVHSVSEASFTGMNQMYELIDAFGLSDIHEFQFDSDEKNLSFNIKEQLYSTYSHTDNGFKIELKLYDADNNIDLLLNAIPILVASSEPKSRSGYYEVYEKVIYEVIRNGEYQKVVLEEDSNMKIYFTVDLNKDNTMTIETFAEVF